jgi:hypothetical protein
MCIAIVKPVGAVLSEETLRTCFDNNPHGAGFAVATTDGVVISKGFFDIDSFLAAYHAVGVNDHNALVHFRITTRGTGDADNCHPFPLLNGALIHNGTIRNLGEVGKGPSDTSLFSRMIHDLTLEQLERLRPVFESYLDYNRVACLSHDGEFLVFNRDEWTEEDGVLFSNDGFKRGGGYGFFRGSSLWNDVDAFEKEVSQNDPWYWDTNKYELYVLEGDIYVRDEHLEDAVFEEWTAMGATWMPDCDNDWDEFDDLTESLYYAFNYDNIKGATSCTSTPRASRLPTATTTAFSPRTFPVPSR